MTDFETEYIFCKDNRLVLIGECLFAEASTANAELEHLKLHPLLREQQLICIKAKSFALKRISGRRFAAESQIPSLQRQRPFLADTEIRR